MWRSIFLLCFLFNPAVLLGQNVFHTTTIDSFTATNAGTNRWFWGAACLDAVHENGAIHMSFYYRGDSTETVRIIYGVRTSSGFEFDTVASFSGWETGTPSGSAVHVDSNGDPWVFTDHAWTVRAFHRVGTAWSSSLIDTSGYFKGIAVVEHGAGETGLVYLGQRPEGGMNSRVRYARWNEGAWERKTLFDKPGHGHFTRPSAVRSGEDILVSFTEGKDPDSIMVRVFGHSQDEWREVFSDAYIHGMAVFISERGLLGLTNENQVHLWRQADGYSRYFLRSGSAWTSQLLTDPPGSLVKWPQGSNIVFSTDHTAFVLSQYSGSEPTISWRKEDGSCGYNAEIPWLGSPCGITLFDQVMTPDDTLHIFYMYGYAASPYGDWDPVVFQEATVYAPDLLRPGTSVECDDPPGMPGSLTLSQNYPNPFNPTTTIPYALPVQSDEFRVEGGAGTLNSTLLTHHVTLKVFNIIGQEVRTIVDEIQQAGSYAVAWDGCDNFGVGAPSGVYVCRLTAGHDTASNRMLLIR